MNKSIWLRIKIVATVLLALIAVFIVNQLSGGQLNQFGIRPGVTSAWYHIFTAPFIHGSMIHLVNNLIGMAVFSAICLLRSVRFYLYSSFFIITVTGILVWVFARNASHIGASGWIFGLWSLSIAMAWFDRKLSSILIAIAVLFFYGGMIYGVLPTTPGVSFEAHLFGAISGVLYAFCSKKYRRLR